MTVHDRLATVPHRAKLRVDDFFALNDRGTFLDYAKSELLDGEIWTMNAQHRPHAMAKMDLYDILRDALRAIGSPLRAVLEASVRMGDHDAPEPDITLTSEPYGEGAIPLSSVSLIIEVADSTAGHDLNHKRDIYARHAVPEYWVVDLPQRQVHQFWQPECGAYAATATVAFGAPLPARTISGLTVRAG